MRIVRLGCAVLVLAFAVLYGVLISIPSETSSQTVDAALAATEKRHKGLGVQLKNPQMNGFLNARMFPYWGGSEALKGPVHDALAAWANAYSMQGVKVLVDHAALQKARDPQYLAARKNFERLLPDLISAFSKPLFQPVNENFAAPTNSYNKEALTTLTMAMNGYAESLVAEGRPDQAALVYEMAFREGSMIGMDTRVLPTAEGVGLQALAFQSLVSHLSPNVKMGPNQWIGLSTAIAATAPTTRTLERVLENDLAYGIGFLGRPRSSYDGDARPLRGAYLLPGMRARDLRIYRNIMGRIIQEQARPGLLTVTVPPATTAAILRGESGPGPELLIPDYGRQFARINVHAAKMTGLAACTGLCAYRAKYGKFPAKLGDLDALKLEAPGGMSWAKVKGVLYLSDGKLVELSVAMDPKVYARAGMDLEKARQDSLKSAYFRVREDGFLLRF